LTLLTSGREIRVRLRVEQLEKGAVADLQVGDAGLPCERHDRVPRELLRDIERLAVERERAVHVGDVEGDVREPRDLALLHG